VQWSEYLAESLRTHAPGPSAPYDPGWLYSTGAQSAAVLVAIIGGLLVSRLVALAVERQGLLRRIEEMESQSNFIEANFVTYQVRVRERCHALWRKWLIESYVLHRGDPPPNEVEDKVPRGSSMTETSQWGSELSERVKRTFQAVESVLTPTEIWIPPEELASRGVDIESDPDLLERVTTTIRNNRRIASPMRGLIPSVFPTTSLGPIIAAGHSDVPTQRHDENIARRERYESEFSQLRAQLAILHHQADPLATPPNVAFGTFALIAFAALGVGFPLLLLAINPVPTAVGIRTAVVCAFAVGLGLVLRFIVEQWRSLGQTPEPVASSLTSSDS